MSSPSLQLVRIQCHCACLSHKRAQLYLGVMGRRVCNGICNYMSILPMSSGPPL